ATGTAVNVNLYDNTVYLSGSTTGSTAAVAASTGPILLMRGNVLVNASTATAGGRSVALSRPGLAAYYWDNNSNNNDFYGTSGIYWDGTTTYPMGGFHS